MLNDFIAHLTVSFMDINEREEGQGLVEYALILVLVALACIVMLVALGVKLGDTFTDITNKL